jgi:ribonuclease D
MYIPSITKEDLRQLPACQFDGIIHVIDSPEKVMIAWEYLRNEPMLGFDTETRPSFTKGKVNTVALLQLSTLTDAFIFKINKIGMHEKMAQILSSTSILKIGAAIHDDIRHLKRIKTFKDGGFIELQSFVKEFGIENSGLSRLAGIILNTRVSKSQQLTNWESEILTDAQLLYAATDAWVALRIYQKLKST